MGFELTLMDLLVKPTVKYSYKAPKLRARVEYLKKQFSNICSKFYKGVLHQTETRCVKIPPLLKICGVTILGVCSFIFNVI